VFDRGGVVTDTVVLVSPGETTEVWISAGSRLTRVHTLNASCLFETGKWDLTSEGRDSLRVLASEYRPSLTGTRMLYVCGHADKQPYSGGPIDNWDLSTLRALAAARFLMREGGIEQRRIVVAGFGEWQPLADPVPNAQTTQRAELLARNRRIEFRILESGEDLGGRLGSTSAKEATQ
jgi:chemotaxis protein MotB